MTGPIIEYPCPWCYKIIGRDETEMRDAVAASFAHIEYSLTAGNISRSGKYVSLNLETIVTSESFRVEMFESLRRLPAIVFVL